MCDPHVSDREMAELVYEYSAFIVSHFNEEMCKEKEERKQIILKRKEFHDLQQRSQELLKFLPQCGKTTTITSNIDFNNVSNNSNLVIFLCLQIIF